MQKHSNRDRQRGQRDDETETDNEIQRDGDGESGTVRRDGETVNVRKVETAR